MALSDISIKNSVFAWMLMAGISIFGLVAFSRLGISQLPDVDFPVVSISTTWEGAAPEVMETEITDALEDAIIGIEGVSEIVSESKQGSSRITIQFDIAKNIDVALQEAQSAVSRAQRLLPRDMDPPIIRKSNPEDQPIIWLTLSGDKSAKFLMEYTRDHLKDQISTVPGVGEVTLGGYVEPNLRVWLNANELEKNELTVDDIISAIQSQHAESPAGYIDTGMQEMNLRVVGEAGSIDEFRSIIIPERKGSPVWKKFVIGDVASVEDGLANVRRISRTMGITAVGLGIKKQRRTNSVALAKNVKAKLNELEKYLPAGMQLSTRFDSTSYVEDSINEMYFIIFLSVLLTAIVCWLFLGSLSSAINIVLTIPMSIFGTLFVIYILGFTMNTFTLLGLSLVIGIVVDNAIMMLENIARHMEEGKERVLSAIVGSREITFAAISSTITILAIFVPIIFVPGIIGKYFFQFGVTISVAVLISLLAALTLTPMYCSRYLTVGHTTSIGRMMDGFIIKLRKGYSFFLGKCILHRWKTIFTAAVFFTGSLFFFNVLKKEFIPAQDLGRLSVRVETPTGSSLEFTDAVYKEIEKSLIKHPEVENYYSNIGTSLVNSGNIMLTLKDKSKRPVDSVKKRPLTQQELMPVLRKEISKIRGVEKVVVQDPSLMGFTARRGFPIEFTLNGSDWENLAEISQKMADEMSASGLMVDVDMDYRVGLPEVHIVPDREKAAERGVSISDIGDTINAMIGGIRVGKYTRGGRRYDIRVQLVSSDRSNVKDISKILVRNNRGQMIRLSEVVNIVNQPTLLSITRNNRERAIRMYANVAPGKSQSDAMKMVETIAKRILPEGYKIVFSGSSRTYKESFGSLYLMLILGVIVTYMVLGIQFNSFVHPFTVLVAFPFSITGAIAIMILTRQSLNIYSAIGIILLVGLVIKNSILLVDFTNRIRETGKDINEALITACPLRLRPILMTAFTTIAAAFPPAFSLGPGSETRVPMSVVVIGGMLVSTLMTLFVVPCVYSVMSSLETHHKSRENHIHNTFKELG